MTDAGALLITGCSTGIGRATATAAVAAGIPTWATARRVDDVADLAAAGARTAALDVTDADSIHAAVREVERVDGHVSALVNNAGYAEYGPLEELDLDRVRLQLETNVVGVLAVTQRVLPGMPAQARAGSSTSARWAGR